MVDRVASMMQDQSCASTYFLKFMFAAAGNPAALICCFEGEDQKYYSVRLDVLVGSLWKGISCDGKKNVLNLYKIISEHDVYKLAQVAYFVDRDFDEPLPRSVRTVIYETPCYSIENFYCTEECLTKIFTMEFHLGEDIKRLDLINSVWAHFRKLRDQFHVYMRPVNLWIMAHRIKERSAGEGERIGGLNLANVNIGSIVNICWDRVTLNVPLDQIHTIFPMCPHMSEEELQDADKLLPLDDLHLLFRGKYELEFVRQYLAMLKTKCRDHGSEFYIFGHSVKLPCTKNNTMSELAQYATTPKCLVEFISRLARETAPSGV